MYYVIEHQKRTDGIVNILETARSSFASGLSLYHERYSKMVMNEQFPSVAIMLVDEDLNVIQHDKIATMYRPPVVETEEDTEVEIEE